MLIIETDKCWLSQSVILNGETISFIRLGSEHAFCNNLDDLIKSKLYTAIVYDGNLTRFYYDR